MKVFEESCQDSDVRLLREADHADEVQRTGHRLGVENRGQALGHLRRRGQDFLQVTRQVAADGALQALVRQEEEEPEGFLDRAFNAQTLLDLLGRAALEKYTVLPPRDPVGHLFDGTGDWLDGIERNDGRGDGILQKPCHGASR